MILQQAPQLETERLILKHFTLEDFFCSSGMLD